MGSIAGPGAKPRYNPPDYAYAPNFCTLGLSSLASPIRAKKCSSIHFLKYTRPAMFGPLPPFVTLIASDGSRADLERKVVAEASDFLETLMEVHLPQINSGEILNTLVAIMKGECYIKLRENEGIRRAVRLGMIEGEQND